MRLRYGVAAEAPTPQDSPAPDRLIGRISDPCFYTTYLP